MNTAEKNIGSTIVKYTENVIIRMSDFYPDNVGGQEFCEVSKAVFAELLHYKANDENNAPVDVNPDNTPTVIIKVKDFYPRAKTKEEYREISREEFNKLMDSYRTPEKEEKGDDDKITVRTRDFAPYIKSDEEYVNINWKTYVALLRRKAVEEYVVTPDSENSTTVKIRLRDFFPKVRLSKEYNDVSIYIYNELLRMRERIDPDHDKNFGDKIKIRLSDFYPDYLCKEEYIEVSRDVYECLINDKRTLNSQARQRERYEYQSDIDENKLGEICGMYSESAESVFMRNELLRNVYEAMDMINPDFSRRYYLKVALGYPVSEIAKLEGISQPAVSLCVNKAEGMIKEILKEKGLLK